MEQAFLCGTNVFTSWVDDIQHERGPVLWSVGSWDVEIGPGRLVVVAGAPGSGKTTLAVQWTADILQRNADVFAVLQNVEMSPGALLDKMLSRFSGVPLADIYHRQALAPVWAEKRDAALEIIRGIAPRLYFVTGASTVAAAVDTMKAASQETRLEECLYIADYVQRIRAGNAPGERESINQTMAGLREIAQAGGAVLAVAAAARQKADKGGSNYENLGLASFRGSSEIEFGADQAFIIETIEGDTNITRLLGVKNRFGNTRAINVEFDKLRATFQPVATKDLKSDIKKAWDDDWEQ